MSISPDGRRIHVAGNFFGKMIFGEATLSSLNNSDGMLYFATLDYATGNALASDVFGPAGNSDWLWLGDLTVEQRSGRVLFAGTFHNFMRFAGEEFLSPRKNAAWVASYIPVP